MSSIRELNNVPLGINHPISNINKVIKPIFSLSQEKTNLPFFIIHPSLGVIQDLTFLTYDDCFQFLIFNGFQHCDVIGVRYRVGIRAYSLMEVS